MELYIDKEQCTGCSACVSICKQDAIKFYENSEGFLYPIIDDNKCIKCGMCMKVCPLKQNKQIVNKPEVFALKHLDNDVRKNSTSGGAFTAISDYILEKKGIVYGCAYDQNIKAVYIQAYDKENRNRCRGSKYVQSDIQKTFSYVKEDLLLNRLVLFSGTPCLVSGLKSFLGKEHDNLITVDFVCSGVVSPKIFKDHIELMEKRNEDKVVSYIHRSKEFGWGKHIEVVKFKKGSVDSKSVFSQAYKRIFHSHLALRPSCYTCKYANLNRVADITIGDFWGIEKCIPEYKDMLGVSLVLFNSEKGKKIKEKLENIDIKEIEGDGYIQLRLQYPNKKPTGREEFWDYYFKYGYLKTIKKYAYCNWSGRLKIFVKRILKRNL